MQGHQNHGGKGYLPASWLAAGNLCTAMPISLHLSEQRELRLALFLYHTP